MRASLDPSRRGDVGVEEDVAEEASDKDDWWEEDDAGAPKALPHLLFPLFGNQT